MNKFSQRLKGLREEMGLTQSQLGKATGISQAGIAKWETGDRSPTVDSIIALVQFFGCSADYIIGVTDDCDIVKKN